MDKIIVQPPTSLSGLGGDPFHEARIRLATRVFNFLRECLGMLQVYYSTIWPAATECGTLSRLARDAKRSSLQFASTILSGSLLVLFSKLSLVQLCWVGAS
ncbi:uncharacterized protein EI90DRAFT_3075340 [Cantharellus anzutake]|uniref:uncharacterized protein n=1 Tax=Cantharellus anzutake TaxID=1750568 RepID=UPI001906EA80|nr:uncharacterized protein EI90DRAFT_3075340 [Cantharellus anzutake]KAF8324428.1 hypothetical protein EI90DRAFT_3075340 [Cantharellus anzutake]